MFTSRDQKRMNIDDGPQSARQKNHATGTSRAPLPKTFRSQERIVPMGNFRSRDFSFPGIFVPWTFRSEELSFPGTFVPPTILQAIGYERRQLYQLSEFVS